MSSDQPHTALMDKVYRRQRHVYDLTRKYYLLGRDRLIHDLKAKPGERIVEIGCGTGRNMVRIAETYPGVQLFGLDASQQMLETAETALRRHGMAANSTLTHALAENLRPEIFGSAQPFDHAIFSYSLSMIPDWRAALAAAAAAVKPEGAIHIVDFGDFKGLAPPIGKLLKSWLRLFHVVPRTELLGALEQSTAGNDSTAFHLIGGRYAFVFKTIPKTLCEIHFNDVAGVPQI